MDIEEGVGGVVGGGGSCFLNPNIDGDMAEIQIPRIPPLGPSWSQFAPKMTPRNF